MANLHIQESRCAGISRIIWASQFASRLSAIDLSHTSAILDLKRGSVGYKVMTTQPWIWVTVVFPECKSIYRGIHLTYLSFNQIPNQEKDTTLG